MSIRLEPRLNRAVEESYAKLDFISRVQTGEKMDVGTRQMYKDTIPTALYRTLVARGESRDKTIQFIKETLDEAIKLVQELVELSHLTIARSLLTRIESCRAGVVHLSQTYYSDRMYTSNINALLESIDARVKELNEQLTSTRGNQSNKNKQRGNN